MSSIATTFRRPHAFLGRYEVLAELGSGGLTEVYLALLSSPLGVRHVVALKRLRAHLADELPLREMFLDEARLAARLNHPNVVQTFELNSEGDQPFLAMEYLDGQTFGRLRRDAWREQQGGLTPRLTMGHQLRVLCEVLAGMHHAHELRDHDGAPLGFVHRDVSPHSIFITHAGQVKVVDFGLARVASHRDLSSAGPLMSRVAYMAPEQARGDAVDRRADVFAVGLMLREVITGERAWKGLTDVEIVQTLFSGQIPAPSEVRAGIAPELERVCLRAMAHHPDDRYATAEHMREDLERAIEATGQRVSTREVGAVVSEMLREQREQDQAILDALLGPTGVVPLGDHAKATLRPLSAQTVASFASTIDTSRPPDSGDEASPSGSPYRSAPTPTPARPQPAPQATRRPAVMLWVSLGALLVAAAAAVLKKR